MLQPRLFAPGHQQPPSPGCLCIFRGKVTLADLPVGMDVDILHRTNELQVVCEARIENRKRKSKVLCAEFLIRMSVFVLFERAGPLYIFFH